MDLSTLIDQLSSQTLVIALAMARVTAAFIVLPIFSNELIPPLVRNAIFVALALLSVILQPEMNIDTISTLGWLRLIVKEAFIGITLGVFFGVYLWAFEAAGQVVDAQIGMNMAQVFDPLTGHQTSLVGAFLGRVMLYVFVAAGGLLYLVGAVLESYVIWPIIGKFPNLTDAGLVLFQQKFSSLFELILVIAAPFLATAFIVDICMGLINREAEQFNVFFLSMPLKMLAAVFVMILSLSLLVEVLVQNLSDGKNYLFTYLRIIL